MSITVIREANTLKIVESHGEIPEHIPFRFLTEDEWRIAEKDRTQWLDLQMPSFIRGAEDEDAEQLF